MPNRLINRKQRVQQRRWVLFSNGALHGVQATYRTGKKIRPGQAGQIVVFAADHAEIKRSK
jgi:hypothetical protein